MKLKLLFTRLESSKLYVLLLFCLCVSYSWSQTELVKNGTCDDFQVETGDNADAWDMTPNSTVKYDADGGVESPSPYRYHADDNPDGWRNDDLETYLEVTYDLVNGNKVDEQPGSTSSGNGSTRGVKLYDDADGDPAVSQSTRRLYQRVVGLTIGHDYNFSIDSRSEAAGTLSEVYILNTQISDELGINANGYSDSSVITGMDITNDEGAWVTNTLSFTATTTEVIIYVRSLNAIDRDTEVFFDNISLKEDVTTATKNILASDINIYPNPASNFIQIDVNNIQISSVEMYSLIGKKVISEDKLINNKLNISNLSKGIYLLKVNAGNTSLTKKIIVE
ncbi:T9SS type A sorting domain-containing protein [Algibacter sp. PT7-4]|uniref:T9SS type A sorting domain-containing protein n=1 Tax=Algibacter ulvanivorans TaxID=3400999 RepID=UPI003AAD06B4